jgi:hypothetical protein
VAEGEEIGVEDTAIDDTEGDLCSTVATCDSEEEEHVLSTEEEGDLGMLNDDFEILCDNPKGVVDTSKEDFGRADKPTNDVGGNDGNEEGVVELGVSKERKVDIL